MKQQILLRACARTHTHTHTHTKKKKKKKKLEVIDSEYKIVKISENTLK